MTDTILRTTSGYTGYGYGGYGSGMYGGGPIPDTTPPATPDAPTVTPTNGGSYTATVSWTTDPDAVSYALYLDGVFLSNQTTSPQAMTFTEGSHTLSMKAQDEAGNVSSMGATAPFVIDVTPPSAISNLSASQPSFATRQVNLSWSAPAGSPVSYTVYRGSTLIYTGSSTSTTDTPSSDGTYTYKAYSTDAAGNLSSISNTPSVDVVVIPPVPSAPTTSLATAPGRTVTVNWTGTTGATSFNVMRGSTVIATGVTGSSYNDTNVSDGTYTYKVAATGSGGTSAYSSASTPLVVYRSVPAIPGAPTASLADAPSRTITVSWSPASGATAYDLYRNGTLLTSGATSPATVTGSVDGSYTFTVLARNGNGSSAQSEDSNTIDVARDVPDAPEAPTAVLATAPSRVVTVTWDTVERATSYDLRRNSTVIATGLTSGFYQDSPADGTYTYSVRAVSLSGSSSWGDPSSSLVVQRDVLAAPDAPIAVLAAVPSRTVTVSWPAVTGATSYNLKQNGVVIATGLTDTEYILEDVADGSYVYKTASTSSNGTSAYSSNSLTLVVDRTAPDVITDLHASRSGNVVTLVWTAVSSATSYDVFRNGAYMETVNQNTDPHELELQGTFVFTVRSRDAAGNVSGPSNQVTVVYYTGTPAQPVLHLSVTGMNVTATWPAVSGTAEYVLYRDDVEVFRGATRTFTETLAEGIYSYDLTAEDSDNNVSEHSEAVTAIVSDGDPVAPVLEYVQNGNNIDLSWSAVSGALIYEITRNGSVLPTTNLTVVAQHNLAEGSYTYTVRARDAANNYSPISNQLVLTVADTTPPATPVLTYTVNGFDVTLNWAAVSDAVQYEVSRNGAIFTIVDTNTYTQSVTVGTYSYAVRAIDDGVNYSQYSNEVNVTVTDTVAPIVPFRPFTSVDDHTVTVSWDSIVDATNYRVYRNGELVFAGTGLNFAETLTDGTYTYILVARDNAGNMSQPSPGSVVVLSSTPGTPQSYEVYNLGRLPLPELSLGHGPLEEVRSFRARDFS